MNVERVYILLLGNSLLNFATYTIIATCNLPIDVNLIDENILIPASSQMGYCIHSYSIMVIILFWGWVEANFPHWWYNVKDTLQKLVCEIRIPNLYIYFQMVSAV